MMNIKKSVGVTPTEKLLAKLCECTFLNLWSYPNPYKADGKELCDLIAIYENHVFIFFDRESKKFDNSNDVNLAWDRWKKEVIDKQIATAIGAQRYIMNSNNKIYLDDKQQTMLPLIISDNSMIMHKIIVAHGAEDAIKNHSKNNVYGSLGIIYKDDAEPIDTFVVTLNKQDKIHLFDSFNLELIFQELDTFSDFINFIIEKEEIISKASLAYSGEEDLLATYLMNFNEKDKKHYLVNDIDQYDFLLIPEGCWSDYIISSAYQNKHKNNKISYLWDSLIKETGYYALENKLTGNANIFNMDNPIYEMAKENRLTRRMLSTRILNSIHNFPDNLTNGLMINISFIGIESSNKAYLFLQLADSNDIVDYELHKERRMRLLEIACGVAKNKFMHLTTIIGITIDAPKYHGETAKGFILFKCDKWDQNKQEEYFNLNKHFNLLREPININYETAFEF